MPSTTAVCPRCLAETSPEMDRCQGCNQVLRRPAALSRTASPLIESTGMLESETLATKTIANERPSSAAVEKLRVNCGCGAGFRINIALRGKRVKCPKCAAVVMVPVADTPLAPSVVSQPSALETTLTGRSNDSTVITAPFASASSRASDDQRLKQEIEATTKLPIPDDALPPPQGKLSFLKLRTIRKQLKTTNVLDDAETVARRSSLLELGKSQDSQVFERLAEHAQDSQSIIREGAITAFGELSDPTAVPIVLKALLDRDSDVVRAAFTTLKKIGDRRVVRTLLLFGVDRPLWRPLSIDTLVRLGQRVLPELIQLIHANDQRLIFDAIVVVGRIGDAQALPALNACLNFASDLQKAQVAEALTLIRDPRSVPQLLHLLQSSCAAVRVNAASGLVRLSNPRAYRPLLTAMQDENGDVRRFAAVALGELGEAKAVPELLTVLQGWELLAAMDAPFVEAIVETIGKLGDESSATRLLPLLGSKHDGVVLKTVSALKRLKSPSATPALLELLTSPQPTLRRRVVETLGHSGDASLVKVIGQVLSQDGSREVRATAARALGELKSREASPFLENALREEFSIRCQAVIAMGLVQDRDTLPALMAMLKDGSPEVRYHAINAIAKFKEPKTLKALVVMLEDADSMVRSGAEKVLGESELCEKIEENKAFKQIVRRARSRNLVGQLIPKWVYLLMPRSKTLTSAAAAVLVASILGVFAMTTSIGGFGQVLIRGNVSSLTISPDGRTLVAERNRGMLEVWDVDGASVSEQLSSQVGGSPVFCANGKVLLISGESVVPWDLSGKPDATAAWKEHRSPIASIRTTPDGKLAVTLDRIFQAILWNTESGKKVGTVQMNQRYNSNLTISPDGKWLATTSSAGDVAVWNVESGKLAREFPPAKEPKKITRLAFRPDGEQLIGAELSGGLRSWDLTAPADKIREKFHAAETGLNVVAMRFLSDSERLLTAQTNGEVRVWQLADNESKVLCKSGVESFALSADEKRIAVGTSEDSAVRVFGLDSGKLLKALDVSSGGRDRD